MTNSRFTDSQIDGVLKLVGAGRLKNKPLGTFFGP